MACRLAGQQSYIVVHFFLFHPYPIRFHILSRKLYFGAILFVMLNDDVTNSTEVFQTMKYNFTNKWSGKHSQTSQCGYTNANQISGPELTVV